MGLLQHRARRLAALGLALAASLAATAHAATAAGAVAASATLPADSFTHPAPGPYPTGTFEVMWANPALDDPSTARVGDARRVMVQVWYPAAPDPAARAAPYVISPSLYGAAHWTQPLLGLRTPSLLHAPVRPGPARWPVLLYSHGAMHPHFSATFQATFLASHGYVVVAIGHPGASDIERFPDGTPYQNDGTTYWAEPPAGPQLTRRQLAEYLWEQGDLSLFVQDLQFVLDQLAARDTDPAWPLHQRLALAQVGAFGWSLGGLIALQAGRADARIQAVANLDGLNLLGLMGPQGVATQGSARPMLLMFADRQPEETAPAGGLTLSADAVERLEMRAALRTHYWEMLQRSRADWYHVTLDATDHIHFSDRVLFQPLPPTQMPARQAHAIINRFTLAFFERYLRGNTTAPLLDGTETLAGVRLYRYRH